MCYRPANAATAVKCLECGGFNKPDNEVCQKCGADLTASKEAAASGAAPAAAKPNISLTPKPAAPKPAAPAPGAPKPPAA